jgi:hypothetical protein
MPKPEIALIVGAGFSSEAGLPLTQKLSDQFLEATPNNDIPIEVEQEISKCLEVFWRAVFGYTGGTLRPSLEDHFTVIDLATNTGHHLGPAYSPKKLRAIRRFSIHRVFEILDRRYVESPTILRLLHGLSEKYTLSIVSVNWDIVAENHLIALGFPYDYGPTVEPISLAGERAAGLSLCKLHGSANWVYCDSCRTLLSGGANAGKEALRIRAFLEYDDFVAFDCPERVIDSVKLLATGSRRCRICSCLVTARVWDVQLSKGLRDSTVSNHLA